MTVLSTPARCLRSLMWLPRWLTMTKPALPRALRMSRAGRTGSLAMLDLDRREEEGLLGEVGLLPLKVQLQGLPEGRQGLLDGAALARDVQLGAPGDEPLSLPMDGRGQPQLHGIQMSRGGFMGDGPAHSSAGDRIPLANHSISGSCCLARRYTDPVGSSCFSPVNLYASLQNVLKGLPKRSYEVEKIVVREASRIFRVEPRWFPE